jgi:hypothetical protein
MLTLADQLAILAFEAALDRNRWLWGRLALLEQRLEPRTPYSPEHHIREKLSDLGKTK